MEDSQVISWIFLSTAMASEAEPARHDSISMIADGINHLIPSHYELQNSLKWLINNGLVVKVGKGKYNLTEFGKAIIDNCDAKTSTIDSKWRALENQIDLLRQES